MWGVVELSGVPTKEEMQKALAGRVGRDLQEKLAGSTVAVCGLGGLGSNIAVALVRAGVGKLILIDFDRVDIANLNRQQYMAKQVGQKKAEALAENLREISPYAGIYPQVQRLGEDNYMALLRKADVICEAFDAAVEKSKLVNFVTEHMPKKYLVAASGMAGLSSPNRIVTRKITGHFYLCGDGESDIAEGESLFAPRVMLCAAHQAHTVLRIIAGEFEV